MNDPVKSDPYFSDPYFDAVIRPRDRRITALQAEVTRLKSELAAAHRYRIEAQNPGIQQDPEWIAHKEGVGA